MVFLDANVILEITLKDRPHFDQAKQFLESVADDTAISMLTAHLIMYFGRKAHVADELLESVINENELLPVTPEDYIWAVLNEQGNDFEDALQLAVSIRNGCSSFITFDKPLVESYSSLKSISVKLLS
ncbi:MAG TPA: type II toxin-antitoxin system VapC family toxin [Candidatus Binatia bacterium]|nr:type II toxin-antitoxin system VapC family toxin [Candidatus Binatia bacterium]